MSSNGTANRSCSTKARRSDGLSISSTRSSAGPIVSARTASSSGPIASGSGWSRSLRGSSLMGSASAEHPEADSGQDRGEPSAKVVDALRVRTVQADPRLLHGVLRLGERAEHAVGHRLEPRPVGFELGCEVLVHVTTLTRQTTGM